MSHEDALYGNVFVLLCMAKLAVWIIHIEIPRLRSATLYNKMNNPDMVSRITYELLMFGEIDVPKGLLGKDCGYMFDLWIFKKQTLEVR